MKIVSTPVEGDQATSVTLSFMGDKAFIASMIMIPQPKALREIVNNLAREHYFSDARSSMPRSTRRISGLGDCLGVEMRQLASSPAADGRASPRPRHFAAPASIFSQNRLASCNKLSMSRIRYRPRAAGNVYKAARLVVKAQCRRDYDIVLSARINLKLPVSMYHSSSPPWASERPPSSAGSPLR